MDRRTALAALAAAAPILMAQAEEMKEAHAHHHAMGGKHPQQALLDATSHCISIAEVCLDHCYGMMANGDNSIIGCARSAQSVIAVCTALRSLASQNAPATHDLAQVAARVCDECKHECDKHTEMEACRNCGDACADCAKSCKAA